MNTDSTQSLPPCIVIQESNITDFLGSVALDILHDSKGHGYLSNQKLHKITDIIATSICLHSNVTASSEHPLKIYVFKHILTFFTQLWSNNLKAALGIDSVDELPHIEAHDEWNPLYNSILIPCRRVKCADSNRNEDVFVSLKHPKGAGVEYGNFLKQSDINSRTIDHLSFVSPCSVDSNPITFLNKIESNVSEIRTKLPDSRIVLDMKASAGLIRSILDPIGYITGIATFTDPGYIKPGMSAIRQNSKCDWVQNGSNFGFELKIDTGIANFGELTFLSAHYHYAGIGVSKKSSNPFDIDRSNIMVDILDKHFISMLPRSTILAISVRNCLRTDDTTFVDSQITRKQLFLELKQTFFQNLKNVPARIATGLSTEDRFLAETLNYADTYRVDLGGYNPNPKTMLDVVIPKLLKEYECDPQYGIHKLVFCYRMYQLFKFLGGEIDEDFEERSLNHKRANMKNFIVTKVQKLMKANCYEDLDNFQEEIVTYFEQVGAICARNPELMDGRVGVLIKRVGLPVWLDDLKAALSFYEYVNFPHLDIDNKKHKREKLLWLLLDAAMNRHFLKNMTQKITISVEEDYNESLVNVLGKFCGDFGQIMWSVLNNHIFATEDNNASALALIIQRSVISKWGIIHGVGNGGSVEIFI